MKRAVSFIFAGGILASVLTTAPAHAALTNAARTDTLTDSIWKQCVGDTQAAVCKASGDENATDMIKKVIDLLLFALGIVAVIMIIWGGIKYVTSRGDAANVKSAKDTVTYAVIGLIVALFAYAVVNFIIARFR